MKVSSAAADGVIRAASASVRAAESLPIGWRCGRDALCVPPAYVDVADVEIPDVEIAEIAIADVEILITNPHP
jgi:hypothetical protein